MVSYSNRHRMILYLVLFIKFKQVLRKVCMQGRKKIIEAGEVKGVYDIGKFWSLQDAVQNSVELLMLSKKQKI